MLNISLKRIGGKIDLEKYSSFRTLKERSVSKVLIWMMLFIMIGSFLAMFLPWTQNIRSKGNVTTLNPGDRPQTVQATIGGKIEKWYVQEGDLVAIGDTIIRISEVKELYMDPNILDNTNNQIIAKGESSKAYEEKAQNLSDQLQTLINSKEIKLEQNKIKVTQTKLKIQSDSIDLVAAITKKNIADNQLARIQNLYDEGLKPLTDLEAKKLSVQEAQAKVKIGQEVRILFDGWPAIVFSGWPNSSYGTFGGVIFAINNDISKNGKYRILIAEDPNEQPWPREVRVGGGANTITLLNDVKVGYEYHYEMYC